MSKHAGHDRYVAEQIAKAKAALNITISAIHVSDGGEVRASSNWVKVHLDDLLILAEGLADCEARVVAAEEQRTTCAENLAIACESQRAAVARADKAERELAGAQFEIADLNRELGEVHAQRDVGP